MRYRHGAVLGGCRIYGFCRGYNRHNFAVYGAVPACLGASRMAAIADFVTFAQKTPRRIYIFDGCMLKKDS